MFLINQGNLSFKSIYIFDQVKAQEYVAMYSSKGVSALVELATALIDVAIEAELQTCNEGIREAGHGMQRSVLVGSDKSST